MKRLAPLLAILLSSTALMSHAAEVSSDEQAVRLQEEALIRAGITHDVDALKQILDDRYMERTPNGQIRGKADVISSAPPPAASTQDVRVLRIEVHGDTAVLMGTNQYRASPSSRSTDYMFVDIFRKDGGVWRAIASQMSPAPQG